MSDTTIFGCTDATKYQNAVKGTLFSQILKRLCGEEGYFEQNKYEKS